MTSRKTLRWISVAGVILLGTAAFGLKVRREMVDFSVNYQAGGRILDGETLYRGEDEHYQFKYSPSSAMIYIPLALLPPPLAKGIWFALVLAALAVMIWLASRMAQTQRPAGFITSAVVPTLVLAKFMFRELQLGQINAILAAILLGLTGFLLQDEKKRSRGKAGAAGILWGLATALKPYAAIFLPYFILKRKWNALWPGLVVLALSLMAPAFFYGFPGNVHVHEEWIASLAKSTPSLITSQDNVSLLAFLMKRTGNLDLSRIIYGGLVLVLGLAVLLFIRRGRRLENPLPAECGLLMLLIPLLSPLGWDYTFLATILAVAIVCVHFRDFPVLARALLSINFGVIGFSLFDLMGRAMFAAFMAASVLTLNFFVILAAMFYLRYSGKA